MGWVDIQATGCDQLSKALLVVCIKYGHDFCAVRGSVSENTETSDRVSSPMLPSNSDNWTECKVQEKGITDVAPGLEPAIQIHASLNGSGP